MKAAVAALFLLHLFPANAWAKPVVIVNPENPMDAISVEDLRLIYYGGKKMFSGGGTIAPANLPPDSPARREFFQRILKTTEESYRLYWVRMLFSGKGRPPVEFKTAAETVEFVASRKGALAVVDSADAGPEVKTVRIVDDE